VRNSILIAQAEKWAGEGKMGPGKKVAAVGKQPPDQEAVIPLTRATDGTLSIRMGTKDVIDKIRGNPIFNPVIPAEAGIQFFISRNSGIHIGLKCHLPRRTWNLVSVRIGGSHANL